MIVARYRRIWVGIAFLLAYGSMPTTAQAAPTLAPKTPSYEEVVARGEALYQRYCKLCHGEEGIGYAADHAPQLRNPTFLATASGHVLWTAIEFGRPGTPMAAFGRSQRGPLDDDEITAIIRYLRTLDSVNVNNELVVGDPERGRPLFHAHCAKCHGEDGGGTTAPSLKNPYFLATASDGYVRYAIQNGRPGTAMMPFYGILDGQQIADVTRLIRSWARTVKYGPKTGEPVPPLSQLVQNPEGPPPVFTLTDGRYVGVDQLRKALEVRSRLVILDARPQSDWNSSHIPGAYPAPFYNPLGSDLLRAIPRDGTWVVTYCECPHAAADKLADMLHAAGIKQTAVLDEGIFEWAKRAYPMTFGKTVRSEKP